MKNIWNIKKYYKVFGIVFILSMIGLTGSYSENRNSDEGAFTKDKPILKTAGYWHLTGTAIIIDDNDPVKNWSYTAANNAWCSGDGTLNNPYLIENITVDGLGLENCIYIKNSKSVYFTIRNCTVYNANTFSGNGGIKLENVNNGTLINNTCTLNRDGIYLYANCDNNIILENRLIDNNVHGIYLSNECDNNTIVENIAMYNGYAGIGLNWYNEYNNISRNTIKSNGVDNQWDKCGISISDSRFNDIIENDIINNMRSGIFLYGPSYSSANLIYKNNISGSRYGFYLSNNADGNNITKNIIQGHIGNGVYIDSEAPNSNLFYRNEFRENANQVFDDQGNNDYDDGTIGNFWDDYSGADIDDDGIGDSPYNITLTPLIQDHYPIWYDSPNIKINSPQNLDIFETTAPSFNVRITDPNLDEMWYTLNNGMQKVPFTTNESLNQGLWDSFSDGPVGITFHANDSVGNVNSSSVTVIRDTGAPTININSPFLNDVFATTAPAFIVEIRDFLLNTTWYTVDGGLTKFIFTSNESLNANVWNNASDGLINITFYANDTLGNTNSVSVSVYKDTLLPNIWITFPEVGTEFNTTAPDFIVEFNEANPVKMWYRINESLTEYAFTVNGTINQAAWDILPEGELILKFYIEDVAGNTAFDDVYIIKTLPTTDGDGDGDPTGQPIPSYPLALLITTICIISTIILVVIRKNIKKK